MITIAIIIVVITILLVASLIIISIVSVCGAVGKLVYKVSPSTAVIVDSI